MKLHKPGIQASPSIRIGTKHLGRPGVYKDPNTGYVAQSRKRFAIQNPDLPKNRMKVSITKTGEKLAIAVEVWATHGTGNQSVVGVVDPTTCENAADLQRKVQITAGACAEHLCEAHGDDLDPDFCAKMSLELLKEAVLNAKDTPASGGEVPRKEGKVSEF